MAKKHKLGIPDGTSLYEQQEYFASRRLRRQRALFIPRLLHAESKSSSVSKANQERAYEIVERWADRETSLRLRDDKETSIDTQFLDQIFGEGLGYELKTKSPESWQLEHKFSVPDIGTADAALGNFPKAPAAVIIELKNA